MGRIYSNYELNFSRNTSITSFRTGEGKGASEVIGNLQGIDTLRTSNHEMEHMTTVP